MGESIYPCRDYKCEKKVEGCNVYITINCEKNEKPEPKPCYGNVDSDKWSKDCDGCNVYITVNCSEEDRKYD
jgi:hypothetical protein